MLSVEHQTQAIRLLQDTEVVFALYGNPGWDAIVTAVTAAAIAQGYDPETAVMMGHWAAHHLGARVPNTRIRAPGAGRKPAYPSGPMTEYTIRLPAQYAAAATRLGAGNLAAGIRVALLRHLDETEQEEQEATA